MNNHGACVRACVHVLDFSATWSHFLVYISSFQLTPQTEQALAHLKSKQATDRQLARHLRRRSEQQRMNGTVAELRRPALAGSSNVTL